MREIRQVTWSQDLYRDMRPIHNMTFDLEVVVPSVLWVTGHIDVRHRKIIPDPVMVAFTVTDNGSWIPGAMTGENVTPERHYYAAQIHVCAELDPGAHQIQILGRSASNASNLDGLAEIKPYYNQIVLCLNPA